VRTEENEETALSEYRKAVGELVKKSGMFDHQSGRLGASPDGLTGIKLVESKCISLRNSQDIVEDLLRKKYIIALVIMANHLRWTVSTSMEPD
jgi:hypothetical protein